METKTNILDCIFLHHSSPPKKKLKVTDFRQGEVLDMPFLTHGEVAQMRCLTAGAAHPALDDDKLNFCASLLIPKYCLSTLGRKTLYGHLQQQQHYLRAKHKNNSFVQG